MTPLIRQALALATDLRTEIDALITTMRPPLVSPGRLQCALFLTVAEQFESVVRLAKAELITHSAVLVRSMLEATADIRLLGTEQDHVDRMRYDRAAGEKRFYERVLASQQLPENVRQFIGARQPVVAEHHGQLHERFRKNKRTEVDTFIAADMADVIGYYTILCSFAHNDITALAFRHQGERSMTYKGPIPDGVAFLILQLASIALIWATEEMRGTAQFADGEFKRRSLAMNVTLQRFLALRPPGADESPNEESRLNTEDAASSIANPHQLPHEDRRG